MDNSQRNIGTLLQTETGAVAFTWRDKTLHCDYTGAITHYRMCPSVQDCEILIMRIASFGCFLAI
jgi:hypothetical protein